MQSILGAQGSPCFGARTGFYSTVPGLCGYRRSSLGLHNKKRDPSEGLVVHKFEVSSLHLPVSGMRHKIAPHRQMHSTSNDARLSLHAPSPVLPVQPTQEFELIPSVPIPESHSHLFPPLAVEGRVRYVGVGFLPKAMNFDEWLASLFPHDQLHGESAMWYCSMWCPSHLLCTVQ